MTPSQITSQLVTTATTNVVGSAGTGSPNRLLWSDSGPVEPQALSISGDSLPNGRVGSSYSATLTAVGGSGSYTWTVTEDSAWSSSGLTVTNGTVAGIPTTATTYTLNVVVNDGESSATKSMSLTVNPAAVFPGAFNKLSPANGATGISRSSAKLTWSTSANATSYRVCLSTSSSCNTWYNFSNVTSATFSGLRGRTTYYWRVEARTADGTILADSGTTWRFTTAR